MRERVGPWQPVLEDELARKFRANATHRPAGMKINDRGVIGGGSGGQVTLEDRAEVALAWQ